MFDKQKSIILSLFWGSLLFGLSCGDIIEHLPEPRSDRPPTPIIAGRSIAPDSETRLLWCKNNVYLLHHPFPSPGLVAGPDYVAFVNFLGGPFSQVNQLEILDAKTGAILWQSERFGDYEDFALNNERAFVLLNQGGPLNIYDIKGTSQPVSSLDYLKVATKFYLSPATPKERLYIYYDEQQGHQYVLHQVDLEGREVASPRRIQGAERLYILFPFDKHFFLGDYSFAGSWHELETGESLWRIPKLGEVRTKPIFWEQQLIVPVGRSGFFLLALDAENGRQLWRTEEVFKANIIRHRGSLYGLRIDATLVRLNFTTGQIEEEVPFSPASLPERWAYWLASDGERLFIYFGDSQEVCALETAD